MIRGMFLLKHSIGAWLGRNDEGNAMETGTYVIFESNL